MGIIITTVPSCRLICQADWVFGSLDRGNPTTPTEETFSLRHGTHGHGAEATDGEGTQLGNQAVGDMGPVHFSLSRCIR